jgi:hypothetical protein
MIPKYIHAVKEGSENFWKVTFVGVFGLTFPPFHPSMQLGRLL